MIKQQIFRSANLGLQALGLPSNTIMEWNAILKELSTNHLRVEEFITDTTDNDHWTLLIHQDTEEKSSKITNHKLSNQKLNSTLKKAYESDEELDPKYWSKLCSHVTNSGFYIPATDLQRTIPSVLKSHLVFHHLHLKYFDYSSYLFELKTQIETSNKSLNKAALTIWIYVLYYSRFLQRLKAIATGEYQKYNNWFTELMDLDDFHCRLPSEQVTILLLIICESQISNTEKQWQNKRLYNKGSKVVNEFFERNKFDLELFFKNQESEKKSKIKFNASHRIVNLISEIFENDHDALFVQETLDNRSELGLHNSLPLLLQLKYGPNSAYNVSNIIKDTILNTEHRLAGQFNEDDNKLPRYIPTKQNIYLQNVQYWYDIVPDERKRILNIINSESTKTQQEDGKRAVNSRCLVNWTNLINRITSPILIWKNDKEGIFPQWNLFENEIPKTLNELYTLSANELINENKILNDHLDAVSVFQSETEFEAYLSENKINFHFEDHRKTWEYEKKRVRYRIFQKQKYYESRMKEFGIFESDVSKEDKSIWIKEMLVIEEEVKPYIQFVKQAFQTALPIRNKIKFSQDRHVSDGVEFDPDTLFDQEKWIRADVMKAMESTIERGEAVQINTFCLDYSGSMNHDRMRNLYKMLCLLVFGLEDRKSYDAFHFFSNNFIEVVNFSNHFTTRKVLFRIMQQISDIQSGEIRFKGFGGTNISEGISNSHAKMNTYIKEYKSRNPKANIVSSIFVITDGEPSLGIIDIPELNKFIANKRREGDVEIKGIFIKSEEDINLNFMGEIFGGNNFVETTDFGEGVQEFTKIMTETYKKQRKEYTWKQKKQKLGLSQ